MEPPQAPAVSGLSGGNSNSQISVSDLSLGQLQALIRAEVQSSHDSLSVAAPVPHPIPGILYRYNIYDVYPLCVHYAWLPRYSGYLGTAIVTCMMTTLDVCAVCYSHCSQFICWIFKLRFSWHCVCRCMRRWFMRVCSHGMCACECFVYMYMCCAGVLVCVHGCVCVCVCVRVHYSKLSRIQAYQHEPCSRYALQYHSCFPILQLAVLCLGLVSAAL